MMPNPAAAVSHPMEPAHRPAAPMRHRPEIDGLRAFAILPILLLHCGITPLRGGFAGVDIFFVISGYLITGIIQREIAQGSFSLLTFYRRRIVRILPALMAMLAIVAVVSCFVLFPVDLRDFGRSLAATAAFGSNIYFGATADYFTTAADLKPLVHTWSLAVEEQFYVLYPLLLLALRGLDRRRLIAVLIALSALSFAIGGYQAVTAPSLAYFLLPSRVWQLMLGGLVALGAYPRLTITWLRTAVCWLGLGAILVSTVVIKPTWAFPVPLALLPAGGAALLIAYAPQTVVAAILSWRPFRLIGLISYSLYLWHRPIIAFYLRGRSVELDWHDALVLLPACFLAAWLSYRLVERPALRRWRAGTGWRPHILALAGIAGFVAAGLLIAGNAERIRSLPPAVEKVASYIDYDQTPAGKAQYDADHCFALPYAAPYDFSCLEPAPGAGNVLLVGDSHAGQLAQALRQAIAPLHLMQATSAGCRPLPVTQRAGECRDMTLAALRQTDFSRVQAVVLGGRWFAEDVPAMVDVVHELQRRGARKVIVLGPMVEYHGVVPDLLARAMLAHDLGRMERLRVADRPLLDRRMRGAMTQAGARYVSYFSLECPQGRCRLFTPEGAPLHIDYSHLTPEAAVPVARKIAREVNGGANGEGNISGR
jgi:peptidoglycan/LPS O-acetylase OafA/YrhL